MEKPLVSIVIPACNDSATISRCLESALAQDYDNLMIVALDNHSSDDTYDVLVAFERLHRDRLYIGRTFSRITPNEHLSRCEDLMNPRTMFIEFLNAVDVLASNHVSRCMEVFESHENVGCVLSHADIIHPSGVTTVAPEYRPKDCIVSGESQMEDFMAHGLEMNALQIYRIETYWLHLSEGLAFNRFPTWLPLVMASSISDFGSCPICGKSRCISENLTAATGSTCAITPRWFGIRIVMPSMDKKGYSRQICRRC